MLHHREPFGEGQRRKVISQKYRVRKVISTEIQRKFLVSWTRSGHPEDRKKKIKIQVIVGRWKRLKLVMRVKDNDRLMI